jgi:uncharacterized protein (TIGR03083 family)
VEVWSVPPMDTRVQFDAERRDLLALLDQLTADEWAAASAAGGWTVKDVAAHLLDGDLGRLSRDRDRELTGQLPLGGSAQEFVSALAAKNQRWVDAAGQLSGRVVRDLLVFSTGQLRAWTQDVDLMAPRKVSWASAQPVPAWLDLARELTETWVHHQQIRAATGRPTSTSRLPIVLRTFVWALPHQYRAPAARGTTVLVDLDTGGQWRLVAGPGQRWTLEEGLVGQAAARVAFTAEAAWRSFTGALVPSDGVHCTGARALTEPVMTIRGIII